MNEDENSSTNFDINEPEPNLSLISIERNENNRSSTFDAPSYENIANDERINAINESALGTPDARAAN